MRRNGENNQADLPPGPHFYSLTEFQTSPVRASTTKLVEKLQCSPPSVFEIRSASPDIPSSLKTLTPVSHPPNRTSTTTTPPTPTVRRPTGLIVTLPTTLRRLRLYPTSRKQTPCRAPLGARGMRSCKKPQKRRSISDRCRRQIGGMYGAGVRKEGRSP